MKSLHLSQCESKPVIEWETWCVTSGIDHDKCIISNHKIKIKKVILECWLDNKIIISHCLPMCKINYFTQYTVKHGVYQN